MPPLYIIGLGGHGKVEAAIAHAAGLKVDGYLDGYSTPTTRQQILGIPVLGGLSLLQDLPEAQVLLAIGDNHKRAELYEKVRSLNPRITFPSLLHPSSIREYGSTLGSHVVLCAGSIIGAEASLADGVLINTNASVDHECRIGRYAHISPGAQLAGKVQVGDFTHIGIGATVIQGVRIGHHAIIGAGTVVIRDLPDHITAVGIPARIINSIPSLIPNP